MSSPSSSSSNRFVPPSSEWMDIIEPCVRHLLTHGKYNSNVWSKAQCELKEKCSNWGKLKIKEVNDNIIPPPSTLEERIAYALFCRSVDETYYWQLMYLGYIPYTMINETFDVNYSFFQDDYSPILDSAFIFNMISLMDYYPNMKKKEQNFKWEIYPEGYVSIKNFPHPRTCRMGKEEQYVNRIAELVKPMIDGGYLLEKNSTSQPYCITSFG